jgi:MFS transporter, PPP family, 3-phenylpropionic acid transporter
LKRIATRLGLSQASSGMISGVFLPFFGAALAWRGLSPDQIGLVLFSALMLRALAGPLSGIVADAHNDRRRVMLTLYWVTLAGFGALAVAPTKGLIFVTAIAAYVAFGAATPLLESVCARLSERYGFDYGRVRIWASTSFIIMNIAGGLAIRWLDFGVVAPLLSFGALMCVISTISLPSPGVPQASGSLKEKLSATFAETRELLRSPVFLIFLAAAAFEQASHGFYYGYGGLHWIAIGYSPRLVSIIWPLGVLAEIALFSQALKVLGVFGPSRLLLIGGIICVIRWTILAFDPPLPLVVFAQFLHGGTFALAHLGAVFFILRAVPPRLAATAQSLYFVCSQGILMGVSTLASGAVYAAFGGKAYLLMSAFGAVGIGFALLLAKRWHGVRILQGAQDKRVDTI